MDRVQELVYSFSQEYVDLIIANYEQFERDGFIGEVPLREEARKVIPRDGSYIVMMMKDVAFECYRRKSREKW